MGEKLNNIDYDSFILINSYTAKDKNNTYKANYNPDTDEHFLEIVN